MGCDEDSNGRGFAPRFILGAGHLETRVWPSGEQANYFKMFVNRLLAGATGQNANKAVPGSVEYIRLALTNLMFATLVFLHVIPKSALDALQPSMLLMRREMETQQATADDGGGSSPTSTPDKRRAAADISPVDTPELARQLGLSPVSSPDSSLGSSITSEDSGDTGKKRRSVGSSDKESRPKENPPTREEAENRWAAKAIKMFPTKEAQSRIALFFKSCEQHERECAKQNYALTSYWRKGKNATNPTPYATHAKRVSGAPARRMRSWQLRTTCSAL